MRFGCHDEAEKTEHVFVPKMVKNSNRALRPKSAVSRIANYFGVVLPNTLFLGRQKKTETHKPPL